MSSNKYGYPHTSKANAVASLKNLAFSSPPPSIRHKNASITLDEEWIQAQSDLLMIIELFETDPELKEKLDKLKTFKKLQK